jgi:hypothetical protein
MSWFSVKWRAAVLGKLLSSADARREFSIWASQNRRFHLRT